MNLPKPTPPQRVLDILEELLRLPAGDLESTLTHVADLIAGATGADKVDAFLYDAGRDSLVALGTSTQPLSGLEQRLGLDVLQISNGGRAVRVYRTGESYCSGRVDEDRDELPGIREALGIRSAIGVALEVGGRRRGMLMLASLQPEFFTAEDVRFVESVAGWVGIVAHRAELVEAISREAAEEGRRAGAEELVTVLAHDLRNYLAPLGLRLELLRLRAQRDGRREDVDDTAVAATSVGQLSRLVSDILDVARLDQGIFQVRLDAVDLGAMVRESAATLARPGQPIRVTIEEGAPILLAADATRLRQCLDNVISNAVQKSPGRAAASIFVRREPHPEHGARAAVEVIDEGPGIPEDILPHVFEPFMSGRREQGGLGLGLYLAKRIARVHGGDLTAESPPGKGARFTLTLPLQA